MNSSHRTNTDHFTSLTPVDDADIDNSYGDALAFAIRDDNIRNIAITGPYGSGKSSIIKTFQRKNASYKFLNISLASFKEDAVEILSIERSILQQMLYGADASKLPYSRFKRISTPEQSAFKALAFVMWLFSSFFFFDKGHELILAELYSSEWIVGYLLLVFILTYSVLIAESIYRKTFGFQLKKFSLKNAEIETADLPESSILNRHLDEIVYFFQATDYDVVVIEDLDRFGDPEIFVKLREINKIINDNAKTNGKIKFLYALKDDMFAHKNRAKFFDFIIPVIPIINSSNSIDKMRERLAEISLEKPIDEQFLREVSLYIDDYRLVHNIFNEFVLYYGLLDSESMSATKLLAMIIYKNVYPNDFECLHFGKGALFEICENKNAYIANRSAALESERSRIDESISVIKNERASSIEELILTYIGYIATSNNSLGVVLENRNVPFSELKSLDRFSKIIGSSNIMLYNQQGHRLYLGKTFADIEEEIHPNQTFLDRKHRIEKSSNNKINELSKSRADLEKQIADLPKQTLSEVLQKIEINIEGLSKDTNISDFRLLLYLVKNGYLDENYYLYISNFYEGRLTRKDRDFLLTIRSFSAPDPNLVIDTPSEVCANMRQEDFGQKYVLNVTLMDYLLERDEDNYHKIKSAMRFISENYSQATNFLSIYYRNGTHKEAFVRYLCKEWPKYAQTVIDSGKYLNQLLTILESVSPEYVQDKMNTNGILSSYLSDKGAHLLASEECSISDYSFLATMGVVFVDLDILLGNSKAIDTAYKENLYVINADNLRIIVNHFSEGISVKEMDFDQSNYTTIINSGNERLIQYVDDNIEDYVINVFLSLKSNTLETEQNILKLLNDDRIQESIRQQVLVSQDHVFKTFEGIPIFLWADAIIEDKVEVSWKNIADYLKEEELDRGILTEKISNIVIAESLSKHTYSTGDEYRSLSSFIVNNDDIGDDAYCVLLSKHPYKYKDFPSDISDEKMTFLAEEGIVRLNYESYEAASERDELLTILIQNNIDSYIKDKDDYSINDAVIENLLDSDIAIEHKIVISKKVTSSGLSGSDKLCELVADLLMLDGVAVEDYEFTVLSSAIVNSNNIEKGVLLLIRCIPYWDEEQTMHVLSLMPDPYNKIAEYGKRPKLRKDDLNGQLVKALYSKEYISSYEEGFTMISVNTFKSMDHSNND